MKTGSGLLRCLVWRATGKTSWSSRYNCLQLRKVMQCSGARIFSRKSGFWGHQKANFSLARAETALAKAFLSRGARAKKGHILTVLTCDKTCKIFALIAQNPFSVEIRRSAALELEHIFWLKLGGCAHPWVQNHQNRYACLKGGTACATWIMPYSSSSQTMRFSTK